MDAIMEMDMEMGLIVLGVVVVTAVAVYLVSVMGIKEKSFEEAIAEQKKRSDDLLGRKEKKKVTVKEKTKKQKKAKEKEKQQPVTQADVSDEAEVIIPTSHPHEEKHHVEIDPEPEFMEDPPAPDSRRASVVKRRESIKSILVNKEEHSPCVEKDAEPANHFETIHPKDDLELKKQASCDETPPPSPPPPLPQRNPKRTQAGRRDENSSDVQVSNNSGIYENVPVVEDQIESSTNVEGLKANRSGSPETYEGRHIEKGGRNRKSKRSNDQDREEMNAAKLENTIEKVSLSSSEIQTLIDILLNKQHAGDSEWINKGKNDSVGTLKKQLAEQERQLTEERSTVQTLQNKLKELRQEFTTEKSSFTKVRRQLEDASSQKTQDIQQLQVRLNQLREVSTGEKQAIQQQLQQMQLKLNSVREENAAMKNALNVEQSSRVKAESFEREADALRTQCGQLENQLKIAFQSNQELTNQVRGLQEHIRALEERKKQDEHNIHASYGAQIQEREAHLLGELKKGQDVFAEADNERVTLRQQNVMLQNSVRNASETAKTLEDVTKKLEDTQKAEKNVKNLLEDSKSQLSTLQVQLSDKDVHIQRLEEERENLANQVASLTERTAAEGQESEKINGDIKNHETLAAVDKTQIAELQLQLEEKETVVLKLDTESMNLKNQLEKASQDVKAQKEKNDELRLKNTKLMDTLNITEKNLEVRIVQHEALVQEERTQARQDVENSLKETFQNLFPQITINKGKTDWAEQFAKGIQEEIKAAKDSVADSKSVPSVELTQLQEANARLQEEVIHYQNVLSSTESLLSNLQGSIEKEERKWHQKLQQKEAELNALKSSAPSATNADVAKLKSQLEEQREEKSVLLQRCSELENNIQNLKKQIDQYESLRKTVEQLETELEEEKKKSRDVSTENAKLNSLVTTGQESSKLEQAKLKQLQDEVAQLKNQVSNVGASNGVANGKSGETPVAESVGVKGAGGSTTVQSPLASTSSTTNPTNAETPSKEKPKKKKGASAKK